MSLLSCPAGSSSAKIHTCVICGTAQHIEQLTTGRLIYGKQAFACNSHFFDSDRLYRGWAAFAVNQNEKTHEPATTTENKVHHVRAALY